MRRYRRWMTLLAMPHTLSKVSKLIDTEGGGQCYRERSGMSTVLDIRRPRRGVPGVCAGSARRPAHVDRFRHRSDRRRTPRRSVRAADTQQPHFSSGLCGASDCSQSCRRPYSRPVAYLSLTPTTRSAAPSASQHERVPLINLKGCSGVYAEADKPAGHNNGRCAIRKTNAGSGR